MWTYVSELGPWVIGFAALAQVWIIALWKRYRKGAVQVYESGTIEVGYSTLGPTIGLMGTLHSVHKEVFVQRIKIVITRRTDGSTHYFSWRALRPKTTSLADDHIDSVEFPLSFLLKPTDPFRYNILFVDEAFLTALKPVVDPVAAEWYEFRRERVSKLDNTHESAVQALLSDPIFDEVLHSEYSKKEEVVAAYTVLDRSFYWTPGNYDIDFQVECSSPRNEFQKSWSFELTSDDSDRLRLNSIRVLRSVSGLWTSFMFAYAAYQEE